MQKLRELIAIFNTIQTTKIRILTTVMLIVATGITYVLYACTVRSSAGTCVSWEPSSNWLIFLSALAGVDITQYMAKSFTSVKHAQLAASTTSTNNEDSSEIDVTTTNVTEIQPTKE